MKKQPKPSAVKPVKGWAIVSPKGELIVRTCRPKMKESWSAKSGYVKAYEYVLYKKGYRCIRVTIIPS